MAAPEMMTLSSLVENTARVWGIQRESRNLRIENFALLIHHPVGPGHDSGGRRHIGSGCVAERLSRLEDRLLADNTSAFDFLKPPVAVGDFPMARLQLYRDLAAVSDLHRVGPPKRLFLGVRAFGHELRKHRNLNVVSDGPVHGRELDGTPEALLGLTYPDGRGKVVPFCAAPILRQRCYQCRPEPPYCFIRSFKHWTLCNWPAILPSCSGSFWLRSLQRGRKIRGSGR